MTKSVTVLSLCAAGSTAVLGGWLLLQAQEPREQELPENHADCVIFSSKREKFAGWAESRDRFDRSRLTMEVSTRLKQPGDFSASMPSPPADSRTGRAQDDVWNKTGLIDGPLFAAMRESGVRPAEKTNDFEYIRRVTLDLTGRIPTPDRVALFVTSTDPDKRAKLVDDLLASPEWVDKWGLFFGDLLKNTQIVVSQGTQIRPEGRNAMYQWIRASLSENKPYNRIARELITATGENSWEDGRLNWMIGGRVTGGPVHDIWDGQAKRAAEMFLGLGHMDCLLCHSGRGHLDTLTLWGGQTSRMTAWGFAAFLAKSTIAIVRLPGSTNNNDYYWAVRENNAARGYQLNTTTGNRPARQPIGTVNTVAPLYPFSNRGAASGENSREALAREITSDFQFARASVNYLWNEFFYRGLVMPLDQFDPLRLDPDNPPTEPGWTLQPSNARLLKDLAQRFVEDGYDLKKLMRLIVTSEAYQLSSRYGSDWKSEWEPLFARKLVRRLLGEELADSVVLASGIPQVYNQQGVSVNRAVALPEPGRPPVNGNFLLSFMPGNRDDEDRRPDSTIQQALNLMNDGFVINRTRETATGVQQTLLARALQGNDEQAVNTLYMAVLSRNPTDAEKAVATAQLRSGAGTRTTRGRSLLWSLYNKVDFIFNY